MQKITLELGYINRYLRMIFSVSLLNSANKPAIIDYSFNKIDHTIKINPSSYFILEMREDTERRQIYSANRILYLNKFDLFLFVKYGIALFQEFKKNEDLFYYENNELVLDKTIAKDIEKIIPLRFKTVLMRPTVVIDPDSQHQFEGIILAFENYSNYVMLTIDEFEFLLHYMRIFNFDALTIQMLHLVMDSMDYKIESITNFNIRNSDTSKTEENAGMTWRKPPEVSIIPKLQ